MTEKDQTKIDEAITGLMEAIVKARRLISDTDHASWSRGVVGTMSILTMTQTVVFDNVGDEWLDLEANEYVAERFDALLKGVAA